MISSQVILLDVDSIIVDRGARQRQEISESKVIDLAQSIQTRDLIHTILLDPETSTLIAGEHRLLAFQLNGANRIPCTNPEYNEWNLIPCRYAIDVTSAELQALELEENIKRSEMRWEDTARAISNYHEIQKISDPAHTLEKTGKEIGMSSGQISRYLMVAIELQKENPKVLAATGVNAAINIITRGQDRAIAEEMNLMDAAGMEFSSETIGAASPTSSDTIDLPWEEITSVACPAPAPLFPSDSIQNLDFTEWVKTYKGRPFNFLHCDFPYGINHQKSDQGRSDEWGAYADTPEIYWALCQTFADNIDKILASSAHVLFWFSMTHYQSTINFFEQQTDLVVNPFPLVWFKSDNKGLLPDPNRGPRRVYETALLMTRGDRKVVSPIANCYAAPGTKSIHLSEKSESMLRHFFRMLVDEHTELFDPTCGSGAAIRAAESLGAKKVLGLEIDPENASAAQDALAKARALSNL